MKKFQIISISAVLLCGLISNLTAMEQERNFTPHHRSSDAITNQDQVSRAKHLYFEEKNKATLLQMPSTEIIEENLRAAKFDYFLEKTKIAEHLGGKQLYRAGILHILELAKKHYIFHLPGSNKETRSLQLDLGEVVLNNALFKDSVALTNPPKL